MKAKGASPPVVTVIVCLALVLVVLFFWQVSFYYREIKSGKTPSLPQFSTNFTKGQESAVSGQVSVVASSDDPSGGPADAKLVIVEFLDYQCPFCDAVSGTVREMMAKYEDRVRFIIRDFPVIELHSEAYLAAEAAGCAEAQGKFWPMHDRLFAADGQLAREELDRMAVQIGVDGPAFKSCMDAHDRLAEIEEDRQAGLAAGVLGTPTFFFNGEKVEGAIPADAFEAIIQSRL